MSERLRTGFDLLCHISTHQNMKGIGNAKKEEEKGHCNYKDELNSTDHHGDVNTHIQNVNELKIKANREPSCKHSNCGYDPKGIIYYSCSYQKSKIECKGAN